jgi:hypothetical protein
VYNGHPWNLKNVAVMQRIVWKRSVLSRLQTGRYGFRLAVVDRWPLFRGLLGQVLLYIFNQNSTTEFFLRKICNINCLKSWKDINGKKALKTIKEDYLRDTKTTFKVAFDSLLNLQNVLSYEKYSWLSFAGALLQLQCIVLNRIPRKS